MQDLYLYLDSDFKILGDALRFDAENSKGEWFNVDIPIDDIAAYLDTEPNVIENNLQEQETIIDACRSIYDRYVTGVTSYDVQVSRKKLIGYKFQLRNGSSITRCVRHFPCAMTLNEFMLKNNFKSYKTVMA